MSESRVLGYGRHVAYTDDGRHNYGAVYICNARWLFKARLAPRRYPIRSRLCLSYPNWPAPIPACNKTPRAG